VFLCGSGHFGPYWPEVEWRNAEFTPGLLEKLDPFMWGDASLAEKMRKN